MSVGRCTACPAVACEGGLNVGRFGFLNATLETTPDTHGHFGPYGGMFVPETLMAALEELTSEWLTAQLGGAKIYLNL